LYNTSRLFYFHAYVTVTHTLQLEHAKIHENDFLTQLISQLGAVFKFYAAYVNLDVRCVISKVNKKGVKRLARYHSSSGILSGIQK